MQERGITKPLDVVFRDEELIPDEVIDFVDEYRRKELDQDGLVHGAAGVHEIHAGSLPLYVQWDPAWPWVRPKPEWAESLAPDDDRVFDQYTMDAYTAQKYRGKIAFLTGIRAAESLIRYRACVNKLNENYINAVSDPRASNVKLCKPLFDWEENDIFRYFYDRKIRYCKLYDLQMWAGNSLRVSTPLHAESAKKFDLIKSTVPDFYSRVTAVFPEMLAHERYFKEMDREALHARYGQTYEGIRQWIDENIEEEAQYEAAVEKYESVMMRARRNPELYPPRYLLTTFMAGSFKREILPQRRPDAA
jgi:predicted phosphoadenosine phosphosulfate sulfurtransferase